MATSSVPWGRVTTMCRPPGAALGVTAGQCRVRAVSRAVRRRAYSVRIRRICGASRPACMKAASVACMMTGGPRSVRVRARTKAAISGGGSTVKPRRKAGARVLEKVPQ